MTSEWTAADEAVRRLSYEMPSTTEAEALVARVKAEALVARVKAEALRELLDAATDVKDEHGYVESFVPEWAVRDELDRIEKGER